MIEGGYLVTNAHVVHGSNSVRVVFPNGLEFLDVPVKGSDDLMDLAVLGPIDADIEPLAFKDREDLDIGSELLLVGYPAESEEFPQPTITRGILSRFREWDAIDMTYFQTDAALTGGQSGGALVSDLGEIIGISGFSFSNAGFGLVASAGDLSAHVQSLIRGADASVLGSRSIDPSRGTKLHRIEIDNLWAERIFLIEEPVGSAIELTVDGVADAYLTAVDPFGNVLMFEDLGLTGEESGGFTTEVLGRHYVAVGLASGIEGELTLTGNVNLIPLPDLDDGTVISVGDSIAGNVDTFGELDYFLLDLEEGKTVEIRMESMNVDAFMFVDFPEARVDQEIFDDDSGGGIFGTDATLLYKPIWTGTHFLVVDDSLGENTGGYLIHVADAPGATGAVEIPPS